MVVSNDLYVSFMDNVVLTKFDGQLQGKIRSLLRDYPNTKIRFESKLSRWDGVPIRINPASEDFGAGYLLDKIREYVKAREDINAILQNKYSYIVSLSFSKKESTKSNEEDQLPVFVPVEPKYSFDQIILSDYVREEIFNAVKIIECKDLIYNQWGFNEIDPVPRSILNFYGEPGTGKTMCAHAIAKHLGKKLLALNYSEIESKYVGEAPKNLQKAFDTAKELDAVLFFDEADSFLGRRIENVTQGSDQALNSLRSQMLIQLELFTGVVLFATNLVTNFDRAFESRILKHIKFELPGLEARATIIKKMIPPRLPLESPFSEEQLLEVSSQIDGLSGREIKNAILEMLLSKADKGKEGVCFSFNDLLDCMIKKKQSKQALKDEEEHRIKEKIERKLKEKAAEAQSLNQENSYNQSTFTDS
jgi:SpoVK/Ycf46/Vps4 family AAA+-type ATPase